ncbi:MAG: hypothetical protein LBP63_01070 [Prevotellaceae bacterium]|jgi:hypothetical protein|nr:hypothetical protein [Prevotellaceae bacterium]
MKKFKYLVLLAIIVFTMAISSCGMSNMTEQEAYDAGYGIGRMLSN